MTSTPPAVDYRPHVPPALTEMWRNNLRKSAVQGVQQQVRPRPFTMNFGFPTAGMLLLTPPEPVLLEVSQPCKVLSAHMYAGLGKAPSAVTTATISVGITRITNWAAGGVLSLHSPTSIPRLTIASAADLDVTDWVQNLLPGDALLASLETFTGGASWVSLHLLLMPTQDTIGTTNVVDADGNLLLDSDGNQIIVRG